MADRITVPDRDSRRSLFERKGDFGRRERAERTVVPGARNAIVHALAPASGQDADPHGLRAAASPRSPTAKLAKVTPAAVRPAQEGSPPTTAIASSAPPAPGQVVPTPPARSTPAAVRTPAPQPTPTPPIQPPRPAAVAGAADLGAFIRARRTQLGLTQQQLADLAGLGRRFVSELESGKATLEFDRVVQCCAALGVDLVAQSRS